MSKRWLAAAICVTLASLLSGCPSGFPVLGFRLTVDTAPADAGTLTVDPLPREDGTYAPGTKVDVRIEPAEGYTFLGWEGCAQGYASTATLSMTRDRTTQARLAPVAQDELLGSFSVSRGFVYANEHEDAITSVIPVPVEEKTSDKADAPRESYVHFDGEQMALQLNTEPIPAADTWEGRAYNAVLFWEQSMTVMAEGPYEMAQNMGTFIAQLDPAYPPYKGPDAGSPYSYPAELAVEAGAPIPEDLNAFGYDWMMSRFPAAFAANQWLYEWDGDTLRMGFSNPGGMTLDELEALHGQIAGAPDLAPGAYAYLECTRSGPMPVVDWAQPAAQLDGVWLEPCCPSDPRITSGEEPPFNCHQSFLSISENESGEGGDFVWFDVGAASTEGEPDALVIIEGQYTLNRDVCPNQIDVVGNLAMYDKEAEDFVVLAEDASFLGVFQLDPETGVLRFNLGEANEPRPLAPLFGRTFVFAGPQYW